MNYDPNTHRVLGVGEVVTTGDCIAGDCGPSVAGPAWIGYTVTDDEAFTFLRPLEAATAFKATWKLPPLSLDFDGVIHQYSQGWVSSAIYDPPMPGAHDALRRLMRTHAVFILTARKADDVIVWCKEKFPDLVFEVIPDELEYWEKAGVIGVTNKKRAAIAYVDDRAVRFVSWRDTLNYFQ